MGLHLYCVAPAGHRPSAGLQGLDDQPVRAIEEPPFSLWVSEHEDRPEPSLDRVRRHNAVVEAGITSDVTPLPIRFGQWVAGPDELASLVHARDAELQAGLRTVAGALEFGIRVLDPARATGPAAEHEVPAAASGREYMQRLARRDAGDAEVRARGEELAASLRSALGPALRAERVEPLRTPHGVVSIAHLVARHDFFIYQDELDAFRARFPGLRFLVSGPWPPYSFTE